MNEAMSPPTAPGRTAVSACCQASVRSEGVERAEVHPGAAEHDDRLLTDASDAAGALADKAHDDPLA
jgi:hypothetical protein